MRNKCVFKTIFCLSNTSLNSFEIDIYIYIYKTLCFLFIATLLQRIHTLVTLVKKQLQHRFFPVNITKFLKTSILKDICERLLLNFIDSKPKKWYKKQRRIQRRWSKMYSSLTVINRWLFLQISSYYLFHRVMNMPW